MALPWRPSPATWGLVVVGLLLVVLLFFLVSWSLGILPDPPGCACDSCCEARTGIPVSESMPRSRRTSRRPLAGTPARDRCAVCSKPAAVRRYQSGDVAYVHRMADGSLGLEPAEACWVLADGQAVKVSHALTEGARKRPVYR